MSLQTKEESAAEIETKIESTKINGEVFSKDYVDFLSEAGWRLEKKLPSNSTKYSDLLEDTDWNISRSASILGINRTTLYNKIRGYGLGQRPMRSKLLV